MTAVYDKYNYQGEIAALALWADHVTAAVDGRATNIIPLRA